MSALDDPRARQILAVFAAEADIDIARLAAQARTDELGLSALDLAFALFEIEDRFDIALPPIEADFPAPTVDAVVQQVLDRLDRPASARHGPPPSPSPSAGPGPHAHSNPGEAR